MPYRQKYTPNVHIGGWRGWCLKYIDDAGNAPKRTASAATALANERNAKRLRSTTPPTGVWVVGFLDLLGGSYAAYDHVFFMKYLGNGKYEIRDSETQSGMRSVYTSIGAILAWFGAYAPRYVGWSTHCDGRQYVEEYGTKPAAKPAAKKSNYTIAKEVIAGKWGNGPDRTTRLKKAGYNATTIQNLVNALVSKPAAKKTTAVYYTVKKGDTLSGIAMKYKTTWQALQKMNKLSNPNVIKPGQKLRIK